jgi:hypothetical protein
MCNGDFAPGTSSFLKRSRRLTKNFLKKKTRDSKIRQKRSNHSYKKETFFVFYLKSNNTIKTDFFSPDK